MPNRAKIARACATLAFPIIVGGEVIKYNQPVFANCNYNRTTVTEMYYGEALGISIKELLEERGDDVSTLILHYDGKDFVLRIKERPPILGAEAIIGNLYTWRGLDIWNGYDHANPLGIPEYVNWFGRIKFTLAHNVVQGQDVLNDPIQILLGDSPSTDEGYVLAGNSGQYYTDANGEHGSNFHLCGSFAVPLETINQARDWFEKEN